MVYKEGNKLIAADALSRAAGKNEILTLKINKDEEIENQIIKIHKELSHRKMIKTNLKNKGIEISSKRLRNLLDKCETCKRKDVFVGKSCQYIRVEHPGDKIGKNLMEYDQNYCILTAIDYFSRLAFAKIVTTKEARKIVNFLNDVHTKMKFKTIITDNEREFKNNLVSKWCEKNNVKQNFSVPYYHMSNGRIERLNRTIRTALNKTKRNIKFILKEVIENYNNTYHRGLGMTPQEALLENNFSKVKENEKQYF